MGAEMNLKEVSLGWFCQFIKDNIQCEIYEPILGLGMSGIGKTESMRNAIANELDIDIIEFRLASHEATDLTGMMYIDKRGEGEGQDPITNFASLGFLPRLEKDGGHNKEVGILVLDEITATTKDVRACVLQLTDSNRTVGHYTLPPKWTVVMLGNGPEDGGMFDDFEFALLDRPSAYRIVCKFSQWKSWALRNDVHAAIIGYLDQSYGADLHTKTVIQDFQDKGCSPRSWTNFSKILKSREKLYGSDLTADMVEALAAGYIGNNLAPKFAAYYEYKSSLIPIEDIESGAALKNINIKTLPVESLYMGETYLINAISAICDRNESQLEEEYDMKEEDKIKLANIIKWIIKTGEKKLDIAVDTLSYTNTVPLFANVVFPSEMLDDYCPELNEFAEKNTDVFNLIERAQRAAREKDKSSTKR